MYYADVPDTADGIFSVSTDLPKIFITGPPPKLHYRSMAASLRLCRPLRLHQATRRCYATSIPRVPLAYDLYEPAEPIADTKHQPIIFMHGLFGSKKNNRSISKVLARDLGRSVYAIDLRNHGESPHHERHDYTAMAEDIVGFIEAYNLENSTLIGHSMGAKTAMVVALQHPELVDDIVSVDNAPVDAAMLSSFGMYVQGMRRVEEANITKQSEADKILSEYEKSLPIRQFLLGNLFRPSTSDKTQKFRVPLNILASALDNMGDFPFRDPDAVRFEKPTLFIRGTQSKYIPDESLPIIGRFFPRFQLADIDAGHWVISEKPEEFRRAVVDFLKPKE